jgi:putative alpha-1,2-mannosidase
LGFYPVNPAAGVYVLGSPVVNKATIRLDPKYQKGREFTIIAENNSPKNVYIQSATLNGKPLNRSWFTHEELTAGGELVLKMGPDPNKHWAASPEDRPGR